MTKRLLTPRDERGGTETEPCQRPLVAELDKRTTKVVIMAGGKGTRMKPYTHVMPKPLVPITDKPVMELLLEDLQKHNLTDVIFCVGYHANLIEKYFGDGSEFGFNFTYSKEDKPLGTIAPLLNIQDQLDDTFLMMNADVLTNLNFTKLIQFHKDKKALMSIGLNRQRFISKFGLVDTDGSNKVVGWNEKPEMGHWVSMGIYVMEPEILNHIPPNEYYDVPTLVRKLIADHDDFYGYHYDGFWLDVGNFDDLDTAVKEYEKRGGNE